MPDAATVPAPAKSFLASKTIWANLVALIAAWLGAHHLPVSGDEQTTLVAGIMTAMNIGLRAITRQPITLSLPGPTTPNDPGKTAGLAGTLGLLLLLGLLPLSLVACSTTQTAQSEYSLRSAYTAALLRATAYAALPSCGPGVTTGCKDPAVVTRLQNASVAVQLGLATADADTAAGINDSLALAAAGQALAALVAIAGPLNVTLATPAPAAPTAPATPA